jgi:hypothetical protein
MIGLKLLKIGVLASACRYALEWRLAAARLARASPA